MRLVLNNRELATVIWLAVGLLCALTNSDIRKSFVGMLTTLLGPKIMLSVVGMGLYSACVVLLGAQAGLWDPNLTTEAVVWFIATAFVLLVRSGVSREPGFIRRAVFAAIGLAVLIEGFVNFFVFSLPVELALLPVLVLVVSVETVARSNPEYAPVAKVMDRALVAIGAALLLYASARLVTSLETIEISALVRALVLPMWLTLGLLPFISAMRLLAQRPALR